MQDITARNQQNFSIFALGKLRAGFYGKADRDAFLVSVVPSFFTYNYNTFVGSSVSYFTQNGSGIWAYNQPVGQIAIPYTKTGSGTWVFN